MRHTSQFRELPNLVVIGGAKTGSTSLHHYLGLHPQIFMSREKEVRFFSDHFQKGEAWYRRHFLGACQVPVRGESSPEYTNYPLVPGVPERMHALIPDAKLIYIVRDPLRRMLSHFIFVTPVADFKEFSRALNPIDTNAFVAGSRQCWQLEQFLPYYPLDRILILSSEELLKDRFGSLAKVFRFLGVDDRFQHPDFLVELNVSSAGRREHTRLSEAMARLADFRPGRWIPVRFGLPLRTAALRMFAAPASRELLDAALESKLQSIFAADAQRLRRLTGLKFEDWSV